MGTERLPSARVAPSARRAQRPKQSLPSHKLMPAGRIIAFFFYLINLSPLYISSCEIAALSQAEWVLIHHFQTVSSGFGRAAPHRAGLCCGPAPPLSLPPSVRAKWRQAAGWRKCCTKLPTNRCPTFHSSLQRVDETKTSRLSPACAHMK